MALKKSARADLIGTDGSKSTLTAAGTLSGTYDLVADSNKYHKVGVDVVIVFHASATDEVTVKAFPRKNTPDEVDTLGGYPFTIAAEAGAEVRVHLDVPVETWEEFDVVLTNGDATNAHTAWVSWVGAYF